MTSKRTSRRLALVVTAGVLAAALAPVLDADAGSRRARRLRLADISVDDVDVAPQNGSILLRFNRSIRAASVDERSIQIRGRNETDTGFTRQIAGDFEVIGKFVRFRPVLPTHLRDPAGGYFPEDSPLGTVALRGSFEPASEYEIRILARPARRSVRSRSGGKLRRTIVTRFRTGPAYPDPGAFTAQEYFDNPPPRVNFANPPDLPAPVTDQYAFPGGVPEVPRNLASASLFLSRVPLNLDTLRLPGAVRFDLLAEDGDPTARRAVDGTAWVDQQHTEVRLDFLPSAELPARSVFSLRLDEALRDLSGQFAVRANRGRARLGEIYTFLDTARRLNPGVPVELLADPPLELIFDWPASADARAVLKRNLVELGDSYPEEVDGRVMLIFTTGD